MKKTKAETNSYYYSFVRFFGGYYWTARNEKAV